MAVGRRAAVGTKTVQPVAAPLDGDKAASAAAAHAAALRLLTTRARTRRTCLGYPVAMRQVNHAVGDRVHPPADGKGGDA